MSRQLYKTCLSFFKISATVSTAFLIMSAVAIIAACPSLVLAQDPTGATAILDASAKIAEKLPLDVVRLSLQVAIVAIICLALSVGSTYRLMAKFASKPCLMEGGQGAAIIRDGEQKAVDAVVDANTRK